MSDRSAFSSAIQVLPGIVEPSSSGLSIRIIWHEHSNPGKSIWILDLLVDQAFNLTHHILTGKILCDGKLNRNHSFLAASENLR